MLFLWQIMASVSFSSSGSGDTASVCVHRSDNAHSPWEHATVQKQ